MSSLVFCSTCSTLLDNPSAIEDNVECHVCHEIHPGKNFENIKIVTFSRPDAFLHRPAQERDSLIAKGATIQEKCPECGNEEMEFHTAQLRSADEGQTIFLNCLKCGYKEKLNS